MCHVVAAENGISYRKAERCVRSFLGVVGKRIVAGDKVVLTNIGTVRRKKIKANGRVRCPRGTGEVYSIKQYNRVAVKPFKRFKERIKAAA